MTDPKLISRHTDAITEPGALGAEGAGTVSDAVIRRIGASLLAGNTPGIAIIMGSADCAAHVSLLTGIYRDMGLAVFEASDCGGLQNALAALCRMAEIFCGVSPESDTEQRKQGLSRLPAFLNVPAYPDEATETLLQAAEALGIPVLRALCPETEPAALAKRSLAARRIYLKPKPLVLPVNYDSAFAGERVRDGDCAVEFFPACELVTMAPPSAVEDHRFTLIGRDVPAAGEESAAMHLAIAVSVSGGKMQTDFEPVIEHGIHTWLNDAEGVEHQGKRDGVRLRLSREALKKGLRHADLAEMIYYGVRTEFAPAVEQCEVTFLTDAAAWGSFLEESALPRYRDRDARLAALTDENTDVFYTCTMCQSIAPGHCCVVTPERCGMCGAITWPDAGASFALNPVGPNRPVLKGKTRDGLAGGFEAVDRAASEATRGAVTRLNLYSLMDSPMTGCSRLECICCVEPASGGVVIADRDYSGVTPAGMTFENLADIVYGGEQTPGFMGVAKQYISSKKFLRAEGGALRIVWMTEKLKEEVSDHLNRTVRELYGIENFCDMIADETVTTDPEALYDFLREKGHPVLQMEPIL